VKLGRRIFAGVDSTCRVSVVSVVLRQLRRVGTVARRHGVHFLDAIGIARQGDGSAEQQEQSRRHRALATRPGGRVALTEAENVSGTLELGAARLDLSDAKARRLKVALLELAFGKVSLAAQADTELFGVQAQLQRAGSGPLAVEGAANV
jgi:hypothetical protein